VEMGRRREDVAIADAGAVAKTDPDIEDEE